MKKYCTLNCENVTLFFQKPIVIVHMFEEDRQPVVIVNEGRKIFGVIHRPIREGKGAAVVICPGFAGNKCGKFRMLVTIAQELAKNGLTVLRFDYRGSGDSEGEFSDMTLEGEVSDTLCALSFLSNDSKIDSKCIGILGRSLGGAVAILAASRFKDIKSIALLAPVFTSEPWKMAWNKMKSEKKALSDIEMPHHLPASMPSLAFLAQFFEMNLHHEMESLQDVPLLHIHGKQDKVVTMEQAKEFETSRTETQNSRFVQLPNSDHDFSDVAEQTIVINEIIKWFQNTL